MNLSASFTQMSLFTLEPANYVSSSSLVKGLKMFICRHAWALTSWGLPHEAALWLPENVWAFSEPYLGQAEGSDLKRHLEFLTFWVLGTVVWLPWWGRECKGDSLKPPEGKPHWGAKYKSQGNMFRHPDKEILCSEACGLEDKHRNSQSFEEWSKTGLDLELDAESVPSSVTRYLTFANPPLSGSSFCLL